MSLTILLSVLLIGAVTVDTGNVSSCKYTTPGGKSFDLTPLIASNGSYVWKEDAYSINGYNVDSLISDDKNTYTFALQVCRNIQAKPHPSCNETGSIFMVLRDSCVSLGNADIAMFEPNPFGDGLFLAQYHGQWETRKSRQGR